jgi:hypothetical protein
MKIKSSDDSLDTSVTSPFGNTDDISAESGSSGAGDIIFTGGVATPDGRLAWFVHLSGSLETVLTESLPYRFAAAA